MLLACIDPYNSSDLLLVIGKKFLMISGLAQQRLWCLAQSVSAFSVHSADALF